MSFWSRTKNLFRGDRLSSDIGEEQRAHIAEAIEQGRDPAEARRVQEEIEALEELSKFQPIWVDLESPTVEEKRWIKQYYGLSIPEDAMDEDIEESARFYEEDNGELHIRSDFLIDDDENPRSVRVAFILNQHNTELRSRGVLFSIHDEDVPVFRLLRGIQTPGMRPRPH